MKLRKPADGVVFADEPALERFAGADRPHSIIDRLEAAVFFFGHEYETHGAALGDLHGFLRSGNEHRADLCLEIGCGECLHVGGHSIHMSHCTQMSELVKLYYAGK